MRSRRRGLAAALALCGVLAPLRPAGAEPGPARAAASPHEDYVLRAQLRLPFEGRWLVAWGGRTLEQNRHAVARDQRFAYDFLALAPHIAPGANVLAAWAAGESRRGDPRDNESYYCYGRPILAPAAGTVVDLRDGVPDNVPGELGTPPQGNHIVIDHGNDEYSMLAHLKPGSLRVAEGDRVRTGQRLASCGNSGRSTEPHLHYHVQDTPRWFDGHGLPPRFHDYRADGERVDAGEPVRGQRVEPRP